MSTLRDYEFADVQGQGFIPIYESTKLTDALHEVAGFETDYEFLTKRKMKEIQKLSKQISRKIIKVYHPYLIQKKDYIANPKPSGYRSLHLIVKTPIFLKEGKKMITVEVQLRTIAMDFWASLEHKLRYKKSIPEEQSKYLAEEMMDCAQISSALDERMQKVRDVIMQAEEKEEEKSSGVEPLMLRGLTERIRQKTF